MTNIDIFQLDPNEPFNDIVKRDIQRALEDLTAPKVGPKMVTAGTDHRSSVKINQEKWDQAKNRIGNSSVADGLQAVVTYLDLGIQKSG